MAKIKQQTIDEKYIWIGGGVLTLIVIIFVWGRLSGKKDGKDPSDLNPNINPITVNTASGSVSWNPSATVKKVHNDFSVNWFSSSDRCGTLQELANLQDIQLRAVADAYQQTYGTTLRKVLNSSWYSCGNVISTDPHFTVIAKLDAMQIP